MATEYETQLYYRVADAPHGFRDEDSGFTLEYVQRLQDAIRTHRSQKADDRCIEDDDRLYAALGDGIKCDRRVGNKLEMAANCLRFIQNRCEEGGWPSYAELEKERDHLKMTLDDANAEISSLRRLVKGD